MPHGRPTPAEQLLRRLVIDPMFVRTVHLVRGFLNWNPERHRASEQALLAHPWRPHPSADIRVPAVRPGETDPVYDRLVSVMTWSTALTVTENDILWDAADALHTAGLVPPNWWASWSNDAARPGNVPFLLNAVCYPFEPGHADDIGRGSDADTFIAMARFDISGLHELHWITCDEPTSNTFDGWHELVASTLRADRLYWDVTEATWEDVRDAWTRVRRARERIGIQPWGKPTGAHTFEQRAILIAAIDRWKQGGNPYDGVPSMATSATPEGQLWTAEWSHVPIESRLDGLTFEQAQQFRRTSRRVRRFLDRYPVLREPFMLDQPPWPRRYEYINFP